MMPVDMDEMFDIESIASRRRLFRLYAYLFQTQGTFFFTLIRINWRIFNYFRLLKFTLNQMLLRWNCARSLWNSVLISSTIFIKELLSLDATALSLKYLPEIFSYHLSSLFKEKKD